LFIFVGACTHYREEKRADAEEQAARVEKIRTEQGEEVAEKLQIPRMKEQVEEVPAFTPTPSPTKGLLNQPVDAAGEPDQQR
jgi:hypothetical protein